MFLSTNEWKRAGKVAEVRNQVMGALVQLMPPGVNAAPVFLLFTVLQRDGQGLPACGGGTSSPPD
jgi:hypothetical protein